MVFIVQKRLTVGIEEAMVLQEVAVKLESEVQELLASQADARHLAVAAPHSLPITLYITSPSIIQTAIFYD